MGFSLYDIGKVCWVGTSTDFDIYYGDIWQNSTTTGCYYHPEHLFYYSAIVGAFILAIIFLGIYLFKKNK